MARKRLPKPSEKLGEAAAVWVRVLDLKPWDKNPRKNDGTPVEKVAESIRQLGWGAPIVARPNGEIIAGHTRWKAAQHLGLEQVPVRYVDLTDEQATKLAIADNRLGEIADWDMPALHELLLALDPDDVGLVGFSTAELDNIMAQSIAETENLPPPDADTEWGRDMPEFVAKENTVYKTISVHFADEDAVRDFAKLMGQTITSKTKYMWHPYQAPVTEATVVKGQG